MPEIIDQVLSALEKFIKSRPGLDIQNYGYGPEASTAYHAELRQIGKDRTRALAALAAVRKGVNEPLHDMALLADSFRAYSGRLAWTEKCEHCGLTKSESGYGCSGQTQRTKQTPVHSFSGHLKYTTGQYYPTEYRKAAACVLETYDRALTRKWNELHPRKPAPFHSIAEVKAANKSIGHCWFARAAMQFFSTRIESKLITRAASGRQVFITSEENEPNPRKYTLREALPTGEVDTIGEFQQYDTFDEAYAAVAITS